MDSVVRNVADLSADERHVYESVLGQPLQNNQRVIVQLMNVDAGKVASPATNGAENILEWYEMWADLSDEEVAGLESAILQRSESRPT
ncbi:MAG: hypothetical protein WD738_13070 [Pirellulales bacterium]